MYNNTCVHEIGFEENVEEEMAAIRTFEGRRNLEAIREPLAHRPALETRRRKILRGIRPPFKAVLPLWELRVGEFRVFYDVNEKENKVYVRAVRRKPPHKTTEDILRRP